MTTIKERMVSSNDESSSRCKDFFGVIITEKNGDFCNGEKTLSDGTIVRFVNGFIDGNLYDENGNVLEQRPAVEYNLGQEFWTKGFPDGFPGVSQNMGYYEEDWEKQNLLTIRTEEEILEMN